MLASLPKLDLAKAYLIKKLCLYGGTRYLKEKCNEEQIFSP